ncbi:MAG: FAD-binding protein [Dehalococcoidia bacterium]|nr:FAD-binding protein [Dehalococcoidia bacterium]
MFNQRDPTSALIRDLQAVVGKSYVVHAPEDLLVYEYDCSIDREHPSIVVLPGNSEEVAAVLKLAARAGMPVTPRGAGTGISGGAIPVGRGMVVALTRMTRILDLDPVNRIAVVEPGVINLDVTKAAAQHGLFYAPDPSSQKACCIGGNIAENSGGAHCLAYGLTTNHVLAIEVALPDGDVVWLGDPTGLEPGYDLRGVFIGSEGTLGIVTKAVLRLLPAPETVTTLLAVFDQTDYASAAVSAVIAAGIVPAAVEMMDRLAIQAVEASLHAGYPKDAAAVLLIELEGLRETVAEQAQAVAAICEVQNARAVEVAQSAEQRERLWAGRKGVAGAFGSIAPNYYILDGVAPRTKLPEVLRRVEEIAARYEFPVANVLHAGDGNLHPCILFDDRVPGADRRVLEAGMEIMRVCIDAGGALTGEHGVGIEKQDCMAWVFSEDDLAAMAKLRPAFGADAKFNPGKVFPGARGEWEGSTGARRIMERALAAGAYI